MPARPDYLAYTVPCPLNAGKLDQVIAFVTLWRSLAEREAAWQWQHFFVTRDGEGFQASAKAGWSRPWVSSGEASVTLGQQVMAQVAGQLKGYLGNVENTFSRLVAGSTLSDNDRHRLFSLNRWQLWLFEGKVKSPIKGEAFLSEDIRRLGRALFRRALSMHCRPNFRHYHPQLDQRSVKLEFSTPGSEQKKATSFPLWASISTHLPGNTVTLPVPAWPGLLSTIAATSQALAPHAENKVLARRERAAEKRKEDGRPPAKSHRPLRTPELCSLPQTIRLIVRPQEKGNPASPLTLSLGLVVNHAATRELDREAYRPIQGKTVAFDLGVSTLLATSDGDLLGRNWMAKLEYWDSQLIRIAQGQQKRGLPVSTPRYRSIVQQLDGFLKTNIFRILNAWVKRVRPEKIVREATNFHHSPNLSRRLNRLLSRFGKRYLELALKRLEATHGIVIESRDCAYTSQQCSACGYIDEANRPTQSRFTCRFCGNSLHADVNAARVVGHRRSVATTPFSTPAQLRRLLTEQVAAFQAKHPFVSRAVSHSATSPRGRRGRAGSQPRPRGWTVDPRWNNPYFKDACQAFLVSALPTPPSTSAGVGS